MDEKTQQIHRLAELVVERGFASGFMMDEKKRFIRFEFTDDGLELQRLIRRLLDTKNTEFTQSDFNKIISFFDLGHPPV